eukprot:SAG25_NODE_184_length_12440_cov_76.528968_11_plen_91_part_00
MSQNMGKVQYCRFDRCGCSARLLCAPPPPPLCASWAVACTVDNPQLPSIIDAHRGSGIVKAGSSRWVYALLFIAPTQTAAFAGSTLTHGG